MITELEIKLLDINVDEIKKNLRDLGAINIFKGYLRNAIFYCAQEKELEYVRIRDDSNSITITYKKIQPDNISSIEHEILVNSYDDAVKLIRLLGLKQKRLDEKFRERYKLDNSFIDIDTWPNIPSYVEIESTTEEDIRSSCVKLGLKFDDRFLGDTLDVFRYYGIDPKLVTEISFSQNQNG